MSEHIVELNFKIDLYQGQHSARSNLAKHIYQLSQIYYEVILEGSQFSNRGKLITNGHHLAQNLSMQATKIWDDTLK